MKGSVKKRFLRVAVITAFVCLVVALSVFGLTGCGEIRYDHYVLTTSANADGTLTITECTVVKDKPVVIPGSYNGKKVKALGDGSKTVFGGCEFTELVIEEGVEEIADNACRNWTTLKKLTMKEGLSRIGANAFSGCTELNDIDVPKSVTGIGEGAFENTAWYKRQDNGKIIYLGSFLYEYKGNMPAGTAFAEGDIAADTKYISDFAFSGCIGLKSIVLPSNLEKIGASAFSGCTALESITIPDSVKEVGERAFEGCTLLETVVIPSTIGAIAPYMFYDCCGLNNITVSNGITAIGESAFENCVGLQTIQLPDTVTTLSAAAFRNCVLLETVTANNLETLGDNVYSNCIRLADYSLASTVKTLGEGAFDNCVSITKITLPESVVTVGAGAFNNCIGLVGVDINHKKNEQGLTIENDAFTNCFKLTDIKISGIVDWCDIAFGTQASNPLAQAGKLVVGEEVMTKLTVPEGVTEINDYAFVNSGINKVTLPASLKKIGASAFANCLNVKENGVYAVDASSWCDVVFADEQANPLYYGEKLYLNGEEITALAIPETVKTIHAYAFINDLSITSAVIPASVETVEGYVFSGCANLAKIEVKLGEQPEAWDADWADFIGTNVKDAEGNDKGVKIDWTGEKKWKPTTNTIMAMVVGGILVVVALVLLCIWLIKKIKKKLSPAPATPEQTAPEQAAPAQTEEIPDELGEKSEEQTETESKQ